MHYVSLLWQDLVKNMSLWVSKKLWESIEYIFIFRNIYFCWTLYPLEILENIRSCKYLKDVWKENLWASGPKYRQSSRQWPESLATITDKGGSNDRKTWPDYPQGAWRSWEQRNTELLGEGQIVEYSNTNVAFLITILHTFIYLKTLGVGTSPLTSTYIENLGLFLAA